MADPREKNGLAAAVAICLAEQEDELANAEAEAAADLFGEAPAPRAPGRPAGARNKATEQQVAAIRASGQSPLAFLAMVWRDPQRSDKSRIPAAVAALPYLHRKQPLDVNVAGLKVTLVMDDPSGGRVAQTTIDAIEGEFYVADEDDEADELGTSETSTKTEG
jgi:hypothetical protein